MLDFSVDRPLRAPLERVFFIYLKLGLNIEAQFEDYDLKN